MSGPSDQFDDLRAQSKQARIDFLRTEVATSLNFMSPAETEFEIGNREAATGSLQHAEEAYSTLAHFLSDPKHNKDMADDERRELTAGMDQIREELDELLRKWATTETKESSPADVPTK